MVAFIMMTLQLNAQVQNVKLVQTTGEFQTTELTLEPGKYQFEIENSGVDHELGFVLVPKGKYEEKDHIQEAYVSSLIANGETSKSKIVSLAPGEYEYFCPLNPTPKYTLTVTDKAELIKLTQVPGAFKTETLTLKEGDYQFEIENEGVDHEIGFVVVPKGKYDPNHHIKEAYVTSAVSNGQSSKTKVVHLEAGEYEYFCPLNPTPKYSIVVK